MKLVVHGARGSTPSPGPDFVRYGGHTSCVALSHDGKPASLVLDAGTGLRRLSSELGDGPFHGTLLLGHLHWDHTQGLPFFRAGDREDASVRLLFPEQGPDGVDAVARLERWMSPPHFPISPTGLRGTWSFEALGPGHHRVEGFDVLARPIPHTGGTTFGYRISDGTVTIAYLSDHHPLALGPGPDGWGEYHDSALELAAGADLLIHDAQYLAAELPVRARYGHSAAEYAVGLAERGGVGSVLLFHHDPDRTDGELDAQAHRWAGRRGPAVSLAAEGLVVDLAQRVATASRALGAVAGGRSVS